MNVGLYVTLSKTDKHGNIVERGKEFKANSLVQAFSAILSVCMSGNSVSVADVNGDTQTIATSSSNFTATGATAGIHYIGIVAGTGTAAVAVDDNWLDASIQHGTTSGKMEYGAQTFETFTVSGGDAYVAHRRTLINNSGSAITINELGYVVVAGTEGKWFLIDRTLPTPYEVANGAGVLIEYKWKVTV